MRLLIAGVLGGIAMFAWAAIAHTVFSLGEVGMKPLVNETQSIAAISQATGGVSGLYVFPYTETEGQAPPNAGPGGFLVYSAGSFAMTPKTLGSELALEIVQSLIVAFLLGMTVLCAQRNWGPAAMFAKTLLHLGVPRAKLLEAIARLAMWVGGITAAEAAAHIQKAIGDYEQHGFAALDAWFPPAAEPR